MAYDLPPGVSPDSAPNWHLRVDLPGSSAPRELSNWTPATKVMSPPGVQAPVEHSNLSAVPSSGGHMGTPFGAGQDYGAGGAYGVGADEEPWTPGESPPGASSPTASEVADTPATAGGVPVRDEEGRIIGHLIKRHVPDPNNPGQTQETEQFVKSPNTPAGGKPSHITVKGSTGTYLITINPDGTHTQELLPGTEPTPRTPAAPRNPPRGGGHNIKRQYDDGEHNVWVSTDSQGHIVEETDQGLVGQAPAKPPGPRTVSPGSTLVDPATGDPIYSAPPRPLGKSTERIGNKTYIFDPTTGTLVDSGIDAPQPQTPVNMGDDVLSYDPASGSARNVYHRPGHMSIQGGNVIIPSDVTGNIEYWDPFTKETTTKHYEGKPWSPPAGASPSSVQPERRTGPTPPASAPAARPPNLPAPPDNAPIPGQGPDPTRTPIITTPEGKNNWQYPGWTGAPPPEPPQPQPFAQSDIREGTNRGFTPSPSDDFPGEGQDAPQGMPPVGGGMSWKPPPEAPSEKSNSLDPNKVIDLLKALIGMGKPAAAPKSPAAPSPAPPKPPMGGPGASPPAPPLQGLGSTLPQPPPGGGSPPPGGGPPPAPPTGMGQDASSEGGMWRPPLDPSAVVGTGHKFGEQVSQEGVHKGVDLQASRGTPAKSPVDGTVVRVEHNPEGLGITVTIRDAQGHEHTLGHLGSVNVKIGDRVRAGQPVAAVGSTGASTGPHLDIREKGPSGQPVDPTAKLGVLAQMPRADNGSEPTSPNQNGAPSTGMGHASGGGASGMRGGMWRPPFGAGQDYIIGEDNSSPSASEDGAPLNVSSGPEHWDTYDKSFSRPPYTLPPEQAGTGWSGSNYRNYTRPKPSQIDYSRDPKWVSGRPSVGAGQDYGVGGVYVQYPDGSMHWDETKADPNDSGGSVVDSAHGAVIPGANRQSGSTGPGGTGAPESQARQGHIAELLANPSFQSRGGGSLFDTPGAHQDPYGVLGRAPTPGMAWNPGAGAPSQDPSLGHAPHQSALSANLSAPSAMPMSPTLPSLREPSAFGMGQDVGVGDDVAISPYDKAYLEYLRKQLEQQQIQYQATLDLQKQSLAQQVSAENNRHGEAMASASTAAAQQQENARHNQQVEQQQAQQMALQKEEEDARNRTQVSIAQMQSATQQNMQQAQIAAQQALQQGQQAHDLLMQQGQQKYGLTIEQMQEAQQLKLSALSNPWLQRLTGMVPGAGEPGGPPASGQTQQQHAAQVGGWNPSTFKSAEQASPFQLAAWRTGLESQGGPGAFQSAAEGLRGAWGAEGIKDAPAASQLSWDTASPESRAQKGMLAEVFGQTEPQWQQKQKQTWAKSAQPATTQVT